MPHSPAHYALVTWETWFATWLIGSAWQGRVVKRAGSGPQMIQRVLVGAGTIMLFALPSFSDEVPVAWRLPGAAEWLLLGATILGFLFAWWARIHLGRLWSSGVTRKVGHHVVDSGPYRLVRHPIYAGIILSAIATALMRGTAYAPVGAALIVLGLYVKARLEERFLRAELGPAYDEYSRRVGMLVPFVR